MMQCYFTFLLGIWLIGMVKPTEVTKEGCESRRLGCFSYPESCKSSKDCDYLVTYVAGRDSVNFTLTARSGYVALGFNDKAAMSGSDSIICLKTHNSTSIGHYSLFGHYKPTKTVPIPSGIRLISKSYENGVIKCRFSRLKVPLEAMKYNLNNKLFLIFASGRVQDDDIMKHNWRDRSYRMYNVSIPTPIKDKDPRWLGTTMTVDKVGCPKTKGCIAFPESCKTSSDCDYLVTYKPDKDGITFSMSAKSEYVAVGFNDKPAMSGTDSIICYRSASSRVSIGHYSIYGHRKPTETRPTPDGVKPLTGLYSDGTIKCSFRRLKAPTKYMKYNLHNKVYLIFAKGKVKGGDIVQHDWNDRSYRMVNVSLKLEVEAADYVLLITHASLMFMAWMGFAVVGMFTARYMKTSWGEKKVFSESLWFQVHRSCMIMGVCLTLTSVLLIFVHVGGWSESASWHAVIGLFVIIISIIQPTLALFRPEPHADSRFMFNWAHRFLGMCALVLAVINCFLGVSMVDGLRTQGYTILSVFLVLLVITVVLYEVFLYKHKPPLLPPFTVNVDPQDNIGMEIPSPTTGDKEGSADDVPQVTPTPTVDSATLNTQRAELIRNGVYVFIILLSFVICFAFVVAIGNT